MGAELCCPIQDVPSGAAPPEQGTNTFPLKQDQEGIAQRPRGDWGGFSCVGPVRHSSLDTGTR